MLILAVGLLLLPGFGCLNPDLVNQVTGNLVPTAPGNNSFLLVDVVNNTTASIDFRFFVDDGAGSEEFSFVINLQPEHQSRGVLVPWPVLSVGLGDADAPLQPALTATFEDGLTILVPAGRTLVAGEDFFEGDTVIFVVEEDARSETFITVSAGRIDGSTQTGTFPRRDTFDTIQLLLLRNGLIGLDQ